MDSVFQNIIRNPTQEKVSDLMSEITPNVLRDVMPSIFGQVNSGDNPEMIAEHTLDRIFDLVETKVLGEGVDFIIDRYGDRIVDLVTGNMYSVFERVSMMILAG